MKKRILLTLSIVWVVFIFYMSSLNGNDSLALSDTLLYKIALFLRIKNIEAFIIGNYSLIRSFAHFIEYFILGLLLYITSVSYNLKKPILFSIIFCFLYSFSDEIHQIFVDNRVFDVFDIFVDSFGFLLSIFSFHLICGYVTKRKSS